MTLKNDCFHRCRNFFRDFLQLFRFSATFPILRNFLHNFPQLFAQISATFPKIYRNFWESLYITIYYITILYYITPGFNKGRGRDDGMMGVEGEGTRRETRRIE